MIVDQLKRQEEAEAADEAEQRIKRKEEAERRTEEEQLQFQEADNNPGKDYLYLKRQYYIQQQQLAMMQHDLAQLELEKLEWKGPQPPQQYRYYGPPDQIPYQNGYYSQGVFYPHPHQAYYYDQQYGYQQQGYE